MERGVVLDIVLGVVLSVVLLSVVILSVVRGMVFGVLRGVVQNILPEFGYCTGRQHIRPLVRINYNWSISSHILFFLNLFFSFSISGLH